MQPKNVLFSRTEPLGDEVTANPQNANQRVYTAWAPALRMGAAVNQKGFSFRGFPSCTLVSFGKRFSLFQNCSAGALRL